MYQDMVLFYIYSQGLLENYLDIRRYIEFSVYPIDFMKMAIVPKKNIQKLKYFMKLQRKKEFNCSFVFWKPLF